MGKANEIITSCSSYVRMQARAALATILLLYNTYPNPQERGRVDATYARANANWKSFAAKYGETLFFAVIVSRFLRRSGLLLRAFNRRLHCLGLASPLRAR